MVTKQIFAKKFYKIYCCFLYRRKIIRILLGFLLYHNKKGMNIHYNKLIYRTIFLYTNYGVFWRKKVRIISLTKKRRNQGYCYSIFKKNMVTKL